MLSTIVLLAFAAILLVQIVKLLKKKWYHYKLLSLLPGPPEEGLLIGNIGKLQDTPENVFRLLREYAKQYYPAYKLYAFFNGGANIVNYKDCELILSNPVHNKKGYFYNLLHKWLKFGLLTSSGEKWQNRRKMLTPAFHFNILQGFVEVFNDGGVELVKILRRECKKSSIVDVVPHVTQFTLQTIAETAMGTKLDFSNVKHLYYKDAIHKIGKILLYRIMHPWFLTDICNLFSPYYFQERNLVKQLHNFTKEVIKKKENTFSDIGLPASEHDIYKGKKRLAMLDLLLSAKLKDNIIDDEGIQEEVDTFMFKGHDTTASALSFLLMLVSNHKDVQERLLQEMLEVLGDLHTNPSYQHLQNLKYMERCIKESLRLYPSVFFIMRRLGEDVRLSSGQLILKDSDVAIHIFDVLRNPDVYPNPEKFDPDRFLPENISQRNPYAYLPFSAGPRNCIGQKYAMLELKAALCAILGNFVLEPVDTPDTIVLMVDLVLRSRDGIKIKLVPKLIT